MDQHYQVFAHASGFARLDWVHGGRAGSSKWTGQGVEDRTERGAEAEAEAEKRGAWVS